MEDEDFDNELSSDDEDYCPEKNKQTESASDNSGPDEEYPSCDEESETKKSGRRKKTAKVHKTEPSAEKTDEKEAELDPEEEKRRADAIWADFLNDTETPPEPKTNGSASTAKTAPTATVTASSSKPSIPAKVPATAPKEIFEFAGETIEIPSKSVAAPLKTTEETKSPSTAAPKLAAGTKRASVGGGLSSMLNQLTKKNKLSVLEKTKLDWDGFKDDQGISEELQTHNRGRDGFLERRDFLERTDLRQFEIEKNLRLTRRK